MGKIQLTPKEVLQFIILGIRNRNYQAAINIAQDCIDQLEEMEKDSDYQPPDQEGREDEKKSDPGGQS